MIMIVRESLVGFGGEKMATPVFRPAAAAVTAAVSTGPPLIAPEIMFLIASGESALDIASMSPITELCHPAGTCALYQSTTLSNESLVTIDAIVDFLWRTVSVLNPLTTAVTPLAYRGRPVES